MTPTERDKELREQILAISDQVYIPNDTKDYTGVKIGVNFLELERLITAYTNAEIAKLLDRLQKEDAKLTDGRHLELDIPSWVEAERAKLKGVK